MRVLTDKQPVSSLLHNEPEHIVINIVSGCGCHLDNCFIVEFFLEFHSSFMLS